MRTVVSNNEIPHLWAHQTQHSARNAKDTYSFRGPKLSSYTTVIAELVTNACGEQAAILSTRRYSVTTTQHQNGARYAVDHLRRIYVEAICMSPELQRFDFERRIEGATTHVADAKNKVSRAKRYASAQTIVARANEYCEFFGLETFPELPEDTVILEYVKAQREASAKAAEKARAKAEREARKRLKRWLAGEPVGSLYGLPYAYMRLNGDTVETSLGASVPTEHVRRVASLVLGFIDSGKTYQRNGHTIHLGHYALDSIDERGTVRAGCHTFAKAEIKRFAAILDNKFDNATD